ncbi:MAG: HigA family addiction module antitoxin [Rhodobacteraceae bacterium]|nr:HigA family addiction module antitoxin [Paracoccaceae bacterium]MCY4139879.1 HigA family addiction module antitoxin [Paracoccaceae bacterium]
MSNPGIEMGMTPQQPGTVIRIGAIGEFGLSIAAAARIPGARRTTLSDLVNGNASSSPEMALRVEKAFGLSMDLQLRMQAWHDATRMRACADEVGVRRCRPGQLFAQDSDDADAGHRPSGSGIVQMSFPWGGNGGKRIRIGVRSVCLNAQDGLGGNRNFAAERM